MNFVLSEIVVPLARRMGTALSMYLIGVGVATDHANAIGAGVVALTGVSADLALSYLNRKRSR